MIQIIGRGGFAREIASYTAEVVNMFEYELAGIMSQTKTVIAIGDGNVRKEISEKFNKLSYCVLNFGTECRDNSIGEGSVICPGTVVTTGVTIGRHVIINLNCTIGHDCVINDFTTVSPGVNISGNVTIGQCCYIGTGAVIREKITICDNVTIGAGAVVVKDITEPGTYVGNPVRKL